MTVVAPESGILDGVGDDRQVANRGLLTVPVGEARNLGEETGIGDLAFGGRLQRVFEPGNAARCDRNQEQRGQVDRPAGGEHPFGNSRRELISCHAADVGRQSGRSISNTVSTEV